MKVVINKCYGGFGLSEAAYEKLAEYGVPIKAYIEQKRNPTSSLYEPEPKNGGEVIFDRAISDQNKSSDAMMRLDGRYWDSWTSSSRAHPLVVRVVEELGERASGRFAKLRIVEIPDDIEWEIDDYDGMESVSECHRSWS